MVNGKQCARAGRTACRNEACLTNDGGEEAEQDKEVAHSTLAATLAHGQRHMTPSTR